MLYFIFTISSLEIEYILLGGVATITNVQLPGFNKFFLGIDNKQCAVLCFCAPATQSAGKI